MPLFTVQEDICTCPGACGAMMLGRPQFACHRITLRKKPEIGWI